VGVVGVVGVALPVALEESEMREALVRRGRHAQSVKVNDLRIRRARRGHAGEGTRALNLVTHAPRGVTLSALIKRPTLHAVDAGDVARAKGAPRALKAPRSRDQVSAHA
jgi:hypothetical protein